MTPRFKRDSLKLKKEDKKLWGRMFELLMDLSESPSSGLGKPEKLKGNMAGKYSRRITDKHRLIYAVSDKNITLISCYGHYGDK